MYQIAQHDGKLLTSHQSVIHTLLVSYLSINLICTVNSRYCRHSQDCELVSSIERVCDNGGLFQSNFYKKNSEGDLAAVLISRVSVIARCLQGAS